MWSGFHSTLTMTTFSKLSFSSRSNRSRRTKYQTISFDDGSVFQTDDRITDLLMTKMTIIRAASIIFAAVTFIVSLIENSFVLQHECSKFMNWRHIETFYIITPPIVFLYFVLFAICFRADYRVPCCIQHQCHLYHSLIPWCGSYSCSLWHLLWESIAGTFMVVFCTFCVWYFGYSWHAVLIWMNFQLILRGYTRDTVDLHKFIYFECKHDYKEKLIRCLVIHRYLFDLFEHSHKLLDDQRFQMDEFQRRLKVRELRKF